MKLLSSKRWRVLMSMLLPLLVSLACATLAPGTQAATQGSGGPLIVDADLVFGPGAFNFPDAEAGLADLSSYKATLTLAFDGMHDGKSQQWSKTYIMLTSKEPAARQFTIEKTGDLSDLAAVFMAEAQGAAYERHGENACSANVINPRNSLADVMEPAGFLSGVHGAQEAGSETVNAVELNHYTFDERALGQSGLAKSTGEMWVASEGGYIVKYLVRTEGDANYFGEGIEGTLTWDYELTDVNQPVTMELPADCPEGMVDAPRLPDASNVLNMPSVLTYDTASSLTDAAAFYQEQLPGLGWTLLGKPTLTDTTVVLTYTQGIQAETVIITSSDTGTTVNILLGRAEEVKAPN